MFPKSAPEKYSGVLQYILDSGYQELLFGRHYILQLVVTGTIDEKRVEILRWSGELW